MANTINNYTLIELLHLSYLIRDSLEYVHPQINVTQENFERRSKMAKQMLAPGNFTQKWFEGHPDEKVRDIYPQLVSYFNNIYETENYVVFETRKAEEEKVVDFLEETIKNYQIVEDIINAFFNEYKKQEDVVAPEVEKCIIASKDYYRVITDWIFFTQVIKNDSAYKKALKESGNKQTYEVNYNLNFLKRLIAGFNFNRSRYAGDKVDIKSLFDVSFESFRALDGSLFSEMSNNGENPLTQQQIQEKTKEILDAAVASYNNCIHIYEPIWRETYQSVLDWIKANPIQQNPAQNAEGEPAA